MSEKLDNALDDEYWCNRWKNDDAQWHKTEVNESLIKYADKLRFKGDGTYKIYVPLCGKSVDMKWLHEEGYEVVGVDVASSALEEFMVESNIKYQEKEVRGCKVYESEDKRVTLWSCNLFDFPKLCDDKDFDVVWDRGSFVAINFHERKPYVELMRSLLAPDFRYLLDWYQYDGAEYGGPPKTTSESELEELFAPYFEITPCEKTAVNMSRFGISDKTTSYRHVTLFSPKK